MRLVPLLLLLTVGCSRFQKPPPPASAAVDERLQANENELLGVRGALERERRQILEARSNLAERRKLATRDPSVAGALEQEELKLNARETALVSQESDFDRKLDEMLKLRRELLQQGSELKSPADPLEHAAQRERGVASREKDLARREGELAGRERQLAAREVAEARREKETCGTAPPAPVKLELPKGLKYTARDVEPIYKRALKLMQDRGLEPADLAAGSQGMLEETRQAMRQADFVRAKYAAEHLLIAVEETKIDRNFIAGKMARLSNAMRGKKLEGEQRKTVEGLFQEATANYGDGKFQQANARINRLFAVLR